jgi:hypothetical protein
MKPSDLSSSGPPGACITPSSVRNVLLMSFLLQVLSKIVVDRIRSGNVDATNGAS